MKKSFKKFVVFTMVCMLALTPMTAFAADSTEAPAEGSASGSGDIEGVVNKDVFNVTLPTIASEATTFDFILDPQQLIKATANAAHSDATFEDGASMLFLRADTTKTKDYEDQSDVLEIVNKSSYDVDIKVTAALTGLSDEAGTYKIVAKDTDSYTDDTSTSMYLALTLGSDTKAITADGLTSTATIAKAAEGSYEIAYADGAYKYQLKADVEDSAFSKTTINLSGSCNTSADADWDAAKEAAPKVDLTWSVDKHVDGPSISITTAGVVTISNLTAEKNANGAKITTQGTASKTTPTALSSSVTYNTNNWTSADGGTLIINLGASYPQYYAGDTMILKATLTDGSVITGSVTFPEAE